ncbi:MMPL family transporter, partial [Tsukamurella soli]|uniref:MMPL family transporter n=1 Tax=Tsukamurella soli TaxID=644556 RepID=UPI0031F16AC6
MALLLYRIGRFAYLNRFKVIAVWLLVLVAMTVGGLTLHKPTSDNFSLPGMPSQKATDIMNSKLSGQGSSDPFTTATATFVFRAEHGKLTDKDNLAAIDATLAAIKALPDIKDANLVMNPALPPQVDTASMTPAQQKRMSSQQQQKQTIASTETTAQQSADAKTNATLSADGRTARLSIGFTQKVTDLPKNISDTVDKAAQVGRNDGLQVETMGSAAQSQGDPGGSSELIGVIVAAVVLVITFASLVAWGLPLINALIGVPVALMGVEIMTHFTTLGSFPSVLTSMIGLAVTIDYALFIVSRYRHEVRRIGATTREQRAEAAGVAIGTAGSAVIFAGLTVMIALAALAFIGISFLGQMGLAAAWGVLIAVLIAITLLPALLGLFGGKVFAARIPGLHPQDTDQGDGRVANGLRWGRAVRRVPLVTFIAGIAVLGVLAIPMKDMKTALPGAGQSEKDTSMRKAYDLISDGFGVGANGPLIVAVDGSNVPENLRLKTYASIVDGWTKQLSDIENAQITQLAPNNAAASITVTPKSGPNDQATHDLVTSLRGGIVIDVGGQQLMIDHGVAGQAAIEMDVSDKLNHVLPMYLGIVVILAFLLLLIAFRSIVVPLTAALGFLLSVVATFGATVAVFQKGALGIIDNTQPLVSFLPIFMIGIVFGLAMDYQVFLVSRMREEFVHTGDARAAVVTGVRYGARVVTAAAIIMISVFASFILNSQSFIKEIGFGLAAAVLFDAFIVRLVVIPSIMMLLGKYAWWLPKWLDRILPNVDIEGESLVRKLGVGGAAGVAPAGAAAGAVPAGVGVGLVGAVIADGVEPPTAEVGLRVPVTAQIPRVAGLAAADATVPIPGAPGTEPTTEIPVATNGHGTLNGYAAVNGHGAPNGHAAVNGLGALNGTGPLNGVALNGAALNGVVNGHGPAASGTPVVQRTPAADVTGPATPPP